MYSSLQYEVHSWHYDMSLSTIYRLHIDGNLLLIILVKDIFKLFRIYPFLCVLVVYKIPLNIHLYNLIELIFNLQIMVNYKFSYLYNNFFLPPLL